MKAAAAAATATMFQLHGQLGFLLLAAELSFESSIDLTSDFFEPWLLSAETSLCCETILKISVVELKLVFLKRETKIKFSKKKN